MSQPPVNPDRRRFLEILGAAGLVMQGSLAGLPMLGCGPKDDTGPGEDTDAERCEGGCFYFAVISDTHLKDESLDSNNDEVLAATLAILEGYEVPVELVLVAGDLLDDLPSDDPEHYASTEGTALENNLTDDYPAREALYQQALGMPAPWYSFEHQGIRFIALNSMQPDDRVDWVPEACGSFGEEQLAWLAEQLADGTPCVLFFHHPLATDLFVESGYSAWIPFEVPRAEGNYEKYEGTPYEGWTDPIYALLEEHAAQVLAIFVGHGHAWVADSWAEIPVLEADSVGNSVYATSIEVDGEEQPLRYHLVEIDTARGTFSIYNRAWIPYE
jgi:3',5'-cyclic AMP phosphodiesterase CpdA